MSADSELLKVIEHFLQSNDFNQGHPRFFNQSQTDSLTKNFDFVVFKANDLTWWWEQTRQILNYVTTILYFEANATKLRDLLTC